MLKFNHILLGCTNISHGIFFNIFKHFSILCFDQEIYFHWFTWAVGILYQVCVPSPLDPHQTYFNRLYQYFNWLHQYLSRSLFVTAARRVKYSNISNTSQSPVLTSRHICIAANLRRRKSLFRYRILQ